MQTTSDRTGATLSTISRSNLSRMWKSRIIVIVASAFALIATIVFVFSALIIREVRAQDKIDTNVYLILVNMIQASVFALFLAIMGIKLSKSVHKTNMAPPPPAMKKNPFLITEDTITPVNSPLREQHTMEI